MSAPVPQPLSVERERVARMWFAELARLSDRTAVARRESLGDLLDEIDRLRAERQETNESLSLAAESLREQRDRIAELEASPLAWAERLDLKSLDNFLTALGSASEYEPMDGALARVNEVIASFRVAVEAQERRAGAAPGADGITRQIAPTQALQPEPAGDVSPQVARLQRLLAGQREAVDGEHYAAVHHDYRSGRDMPETGGTP